MRLHRILFPTDFSECSQAALHMATALARDSGARLMIVHVQEPAPAYGGGNLDLALDELATDTLKRELERISPDDPRVPCEHRLVTGDPARAIVELAEDENVDQIVMSTHGRSGLKRLLMGSVAEEIVRTAPCPVLTLKEPHEVSSEPGERWKDF